MCLTPSTVVFSMISWCYLYCYLDGTIYQPIVPCGDHGAIFFGLSCITNLVTGDTNGPTFKYNLPNIFVQAYILGLIIDILIMFKLIFLSLTDYTNVIWKTGVNSSDARDEIILERLNLLFGLVFLILYWQYKLIFDLQVCHFLLPLISCFQEPESMV